MTKKEYYELELGRTGDWTAYLLEHSNLPGPRANIELMQAFVGMASEKDILPLLDNTPDIAPVDNPLEFLAFCGTAGLGELVSNGMKEYLPDFRRQASDPRWRIREAVAMGLQIIGKNDFWLLEEICREWCRGNFLEQRAAAAGICEPGLLSETDHANAALDILEKISAELLPAQDRKDEEFKILTKGLSYCWSVAIVAAPENGKEKFEKLARSNDPDIIQVVRENLKKNRLIRMDPGWVDAITQSL